MSDISAPIADASPAPAATPAPTPAPAENASDSVQPLGDRPVNTETQPAAPAPKPVEAKKPSISESLKSAESKIEASEKAKRDEERALKANEKPTDKTAVDPKTAKLDTKPLDAPKPALEPPARWKPEVKAKWDKLDDDVKSEVDRTVKELEKGYEKYKTAADKFETLKEYDTLATANKTDLKSALDRYVGLDKALNSQNGQEKLAAIEEVLRVAKVSPKDYANYVLGQPADQLASKNDATIRDLQNQVAQLTQQGRQTQQTFEQQQRSQAEASLNKWAEGKPHVNELVPQIVTHVKAGLSLDDAYTTAVTEAQALSAKLGYAPASQAAPIAPTAPRPTGKSITGAPTAGSFSATQAPSKSAAEAVRRAFEALA